MACLDLIGKAVGKPVCDLTGGRARDCAPFSAYLFYKHGGRGRRGRRRARGRIRRSARAAAIVRQAKQMIARYGFAEIKLKGGVLDPDVEIAEHPSAARRVWARSIRCASIRTAPGRSRPRSRWARRCKEELTGGGYLEDPTAALEGMAEVRRRLLAKGIDTPLASNVAVTSFEHVPEARQLDAVQIVLSDPHYWGGMRQSAAALAFVRSARPGRVDAFEQSPGRQHDDHGACRGGVRASDSRLRHALPLADRTGRSGGGGRVPIVNGCVEFPDQAGPGSRTRLRSAGARPRTV